MKKVFSIFLLVAFLFSSIELKEFFKLSILFEHFQEHKIKNPNVTVSDFLIMHYGLTDDHDGDAEKDEQLPFKNHHDCFFAHSQLAIYQSSAISIKSEEEKIQNSFFILHFNFSKGLGNNIWQPPKHNFLS